MHKKHRSSSLILAVLCAVGVHTVLFTDAGHRIQGDITESSAEVNTSDSSLILNGETISLVIQKDIPQATKITASLVYNNEGITLSQPKSSLRSITKENEDYSDDISIIFTRPADIIKGTVVSTWKIEKVLPEIHTVNLTDVQIESPSGTIILSTKGTGEF